ncbi:Ig-like domain-containing protein [Gemmata sp.]|uniref:Ig-like domain-containing protein n=1 Tax=Gemmata sp. TaxID=1914242 RepID=UPI003F6FCEB0
MPSTSPVTETFDTTAAPALPSGWTRWTNNGTDSVVTAAGDGVGGSTALVLRGASAAASRAWSGDAVGRDDAAAVTVWADSLVQSFVFTRGSNLGTATPSYLAAVVTRGLNVQLWEVTNGSVRVLGSVTSPGSDYLSNRWVRVSLVPVGNNVTVQVTRSDTGQYLGANGRWQAAPAGAIAAATTLAPETGHAGVGRAASYSGPARLDSFTVTPGTPAPPPPQVPLGVKESFDAAAGGALPTGWQGWTGGNPGAFGTTMAVALSGATGLVSTGGSSTASRVWAATPMPADADASIAVYASGIVPAGVFVRGSNVDTATPTFYLARVTRGVEVTVVRVVNGVETPLAALKSSAYLSAAWVRVRLVAEGDRLRATVVRADTGQWLTPAGAWSDAPDVALEVRDAAITGGGYAGVARAPKYSGEVAFDDFEAKPASAAAGPQVTVAPTAGGPQLTGEVAFRATVTGSPIRVEFWLNGVLRAVSAAGTATWTVDTATLSNGSYTLTVRAFDAAGNLGVGTYAFTTSNANATPLPVPTIPQHYSWVRVAQLAYSGNPMGAFEQGLLRNSVDLVVPNPRYFSTIDATSPNTPQLMYSNVSNLYGSLLTDWLAYADAHGVSREQAFYHVTRATPFTGNSPSSQPVTWFWGVYQTPAGGATATNHTNPARGGTGTAAAFGAAGATTAIGYPEKFREMNFAFTRAAAAGWSGVLEYPTAVDASGKPTAWKALTLLSDGTGGMKQAGAVTFEPPADWVAASVGGSAALYYVRVRATAGTAAQAPVLKTVLGRDYVGANGTEAGTIPAYDRAADANGDGYLSNAEYANRKPGMDARFEYESRLFYPYYGQMRFATNPSAAATRSWAADYHVRTLAANPLADGIFMDNATGKVAFPGVSVLESTATYGLDSGALMRAVSRAVAPRWVMANTAGGGAVDGNYTAGGSVGAYEEFAIRPMQANWAEVSDLATLVAGRLASGATYLVIDTHPGGGSPTDPRTQLGALAYYYLLADPQRTFINFNGGHNPASTWTEHWTDAVKVDVGAPAGAMKVLATGADPANAALSYRVLAREYTNALVLYKPLSYATGKPEGTTAANTATTHQLGGSYRAVNADGTLGAVVTSITLMNGQGAVLVKA